MPSTIVTPADSALYASASLAGCSFSAALSRSLGYSCPGRSVLAAEYWLSDLSTCAISPFRDPRSHDPHQEHICLTVHAFDSHLDCLAGVPDWPATRDGGLGGVTARATTSGVRALEGIRHRREPHGVVLNDSPRAGHGAVLYWYDRCSRHPVWCGGITAGPACHAGRWCYPANAAAWRRACFRSVLGENDQFAAGNQSGQKTTVYRGEISFDGGYTSSCHEGRQLRTRQQRRSLAGKDANFWGVVGWDSRRRSNFFAHHWLLGSASPLTGAAARASTAKESMSRVRTSERKGARR